MSLICFIEPVEGFAVTLIYPRDCLLCPKGEETKEGAFHGGIGGGIVRAFETEDNQ